MPTPKVNGVTIANEPIWSAATGRTSSGKMVGTIIAHKTTLKITWPPLTLAQAKTISDAVGTSTEFFSVKFTDEGGTTKTLTMYAGTPTFTQYSWAAGMQYVMDVSVTLIEQ